MDLEHLQSTVLAHCQRELAGWRDLTLEDVELDPPKGFSTFTVGVRPRRPVDPPAALYRRLAGKENAILDAETERAVFLRLGEHGIAAPCFAYRDGYRIEAFHRGHTLTAAEALEPSIQRGIAEQLARLHRIEPPADVPRASFFELLHAKWGPMAARVLARPEQFPPEERPLCDALAPIHEPAILERVLRCVPAGERVLCHNDTYHGNIMRLDSGDIRLLDFEFSCRNHRAFDFANLFAETVMVHGLPAPPHFRIGAAPYTEDDIHRFVGFYLEAAEGEARPDRQAMLVQDTIRLIPLSDFMYAMAALPLALAPIQRIRFLPYAAQRFRQFLEAVPVTGSGGDRAAGSGSPATASRPRS